METKGISVLDYLEKKQVLRRGEYLKKKTSLDSQIDIANLEATVQATEFQENWLLDR